ncbi:MAG: helix-turn-helix transcriptional regulator [Ectothiorhodospiraceae bacterium]|nr:helix-turn-helix transcriptional regulator [Ectothiorhodospiraceae bacterium]
MKHPLRVTVIDGEHRHGMFAALRAREDRAFSEQEEQIFLHAARHLAYAFELERAGRLVHGESIEGEDAGFLLLDASGKLLHGCELGLLLFHEATRADGLAQQAAATRETLPAALAARARDARPSQEFVLSNRRGTFVFRPFLMRSASASGAAPVAVTVRRRGPVAARLWQESARFGLSPRERQIAVLLGMGSSYEDIADRIAVSRNTAVSYVRRTYEKLGVHQREQLLRQLLASTVIPDPLHPAP